MRFDGERIKEARLNASMTQDALGKAIGVKGVTIMRYEKNQREPGFEQLQAIADATGVTLWFLMGADETDTVEKSQRQAVEGKKYAAVFESVETALQALYGKKRDVPVKGKKLNSSVEVYGEGESAIAFVGDESKGMIVDAVLNLIETLVKYVGLKPEEAIKQELELIDRDDFIEQVEKYRE